MGKRKKFAVVLSIVALAGSLLAGCSNSNSDSSDSAAANAQNADKPANANTNKPANADADKPANAAPSDDAGTTPTSDTPTDGGGIVISSFSDIVSINPMYVQDTASGDAAAFVYANLFDLDRQGNLAAEPWSLAAELPAISADGLTYTVKLKPEAKWSDGQPVTADDVKYTFDTMKNPDAGSPGISMVDKVDAVTKIDDHTVAFKLKQIFAPFRYALASAMAPYHVLKDVPVKDLAKNAFGSDPSNTVTNGPWKWSKWEHGQYLTFDADANYWGSTKPHIQTITYKIYADQNTETQALLKGDVDLTEAVPLTTLDAVKAKSDIDIILKPGPQYEYMQFNFNGANFPDKYSLFQSQKTRQAIATAINRQGMVDNILKGTGTLMNAPFLPNSWADPKDAAVNYAYDTEKAKAMLAEDGWKPGKDGILVKDGHRFAFELQYNAGNSRREQVAAVIQQNLKDVGIEVTPKAIDFASWIDQNVTPGKYQALLLSWSLSNPDPDGESIFSSKYFPPAGQNSGWYKNEKLDALWVKGYSTVDQNERKAIYADVAKEISTDLPYVFLYQYGLPEAVAKNKVHFAEADRPESSLAYGYFFHMINWWVTP
ncbi:peptide ABC transporter substrate-binding protein [Paenibacillus rhizovicinus]|uniref:Peptide ABC transporter substrate-binding protein n=1 Tax=Paenibacillus rhizovicinus TaxID=2704463 RepID=A0A6C0PAQ6_9BACL|nr:ABC transporter substrate-binding protein [Paenibacillus rhizovicinus]QHW33632.1 peptide ABC transporter substrate-binding protein [Paenibacillus rhizovicinus]